MTVNKDLHIPSILDLLESAGRVIMDYYHSEKIQIDLKEDKSPVTNADKASNELILKRLLDLFPDIPTISEESEPAAYEIRKNWAYCWMLDPLDGTKEFINRNGEFSINLALIFMNKPIAGFIHFPVQGWTYYAIQGEGSYKKTLSSVNRLSSFGDQSSKIENRRSKITIMISRSHSGHREQEFIGQCKTIGYDVKTRPHGSAMKHCLLAEGIGDIYPKFGICYEWDTAPGQLILEEAGGRVLRTDNGEALSYNKADFENPEFIMMGPTCPTDLLRKLPNN